jgi:hypothetical protein
MNDFLEEIDKNLETHFADIIPQDEIELLCFETLEDEIPESKEITEITEITLNMFFENYIKIINKSDAIIRSYILRWIYIGNNCFMYR